MAAAKRAKALEWVRAVDPAGALARWGVGALQPEVVAHAVSIDDSARAQGLTETWSCSAETLRLAQEASLASERAPAEPAAESPTHAFFKRLAPQVRKKNLASVHDRNDWQVMPDGQAVPMSTKKWQMLTRPEAQGGGGGGGGGGEGEGFEEPDDVEDAEGGEEDDDEGGDSEGDAEGAEDDEEDEAGDDEGDEEGDEEEEEDDESEASERAVEEDADAEDVDVDDADAEADEAEADSDASDGEAAPAQSLRRIFKRLDSIGVVNPQMFSMN